MANSASGDSAVDRVVRIIEAFPEGVNFAAIERAG